jgi:beta-glucosidase
MTITFPEGFLWGTATAAHQVEGGNWNNDWWAWEHTPGSRVKEPSGDACDHWHRYPDDIALLADLGFGAYRFSLEWSRVEPEEGEWSRASLDHYRRMCATCHEQGVLPVVTFHHFTTPRWLAAQGGWEKNDAPDLFGRYCERAIEAIGDLVPWACTINEPNVVATMGYLAAAFPPGKQDIETRRRVNDVLIAAHRRAADAIHSGPGNAQVGLTLSMAQWWPVEGGEARIERIRRNMEDVYLEAARADDFIGVQTYSRNRIGPDGALGPEDGVETTIMGYEFWPQALEATIRRASAVTDGVPVCVTENGIAATDDSRRIEFVRRALQGVKACLDDGIEVIGYTYWSALDNFEWSLGYGPTFGLIAVDRTSFRRDPKPSASWLGAVARANALSDA